MKMRWILLLMMTSSWIVSAQDKAPEAAPKAGEVVRVIEIKQGDVEGIYNLLRQVLPGGTVISRDASRKVLIVRGSADVVGVIEEAAKKLDVAPAPAPPKSAPPATSLELTVYVLQGSSQQAADSLPPALESTVKQLRAIFPFKSYRLMDSWLLMGRDGQFLDSSGTLPGSRITYNFRLQPWIIRDTQPRSVRLSGLKLGLQIPVTEGPMTNFCERGIFPRRWDAKDGQRTVIGKSNISGTEDAVILVVTPKIIE